MLPILSPTDSQTHSTLPKLSPCERVVRFRFESDASLYRSFGGKRVVADVEGTGSIHVQHSETALSLHSESYFETMFPASFENYCVVFAEGPGLVELSVRISPSAGDVEFPQDFGNPITINPQPSADICTYKGKGWIVGASGPIRIDDRHIWEPPPSAGEPLPFWLQVETTGSLSVLPAAGGASERVDFIDIGGEDGLALHQWRAKNMSKLSLLTSTFQDGTPLTAATAVHLNAANFVFQVPPENQGVVLRRIFDQFHGRQRARVFVDGEFAGWWYEPAEHKTARWRVSDFGLPPELTRGKSTLNITIDPPSGATLWSVSRLECWSFR